MSLTSLYEKTGPDESTGKAKPSDEHSPSRSTTGRKSKRPKTAKPSKKSGGRLLKRSKKGVEKNTKFGSDNAVPDTELLAAPMPWRRRRALKLPTHRATTAHSCTLFPWGVHGSLGNKGPYLGHDTLAGGGAFHFDLFETYDTQSLGAGSVTNTNMMILGKPGMGKSALIKTMLYRTAAVYGSDRFFAILDVKSEYGELAKLLGLPVIRLSPGGTTRVNPMQIRNEVPPEQRAERRNTMMVAMLGAVMNRRLTPVEEVALWTAITILDTPGRGQPTIADVARLLVTPTSEMVTATRLNPDGLAEELRDIGYAIEKLISRSLQGMFDGQSTTQIDPYGRGVVIDISSVKESKEALPVVMVAATAWLQDILNTHTGVKKLQVLDESWQMVQFEGTARYLQAAWKLGRTYGVGNIAILHKAADLGAQSDDGTATSKIVEGLIADTAIKVSFAMTPQDLADDADLLQVSEREQDKITELTRGESLWKIGSHVVALKHHLPEGGVEAVLCDTDQALEAAKP